MSGSGAATVRYHEEGPIGVITLDRPEKLNALSPAVLDDLAEAARLLTQSRHARVGVLAGAGRAFLAGADIEHYLNLSIHEYRAFMERGRAVQDLLLRCPKIIVAAVQGYAVGGGLELALCCDFIVAETDARLGVPEVKLGLLPGGGGTQRLPRIVGDRRAMDLLVTGRLLDAPEAFAWGLVSRLVPPGEALSGAVELATVVARRAPLAVQLAKRLVREGSDVALETALTLEHAETAALYLTDDATEGIAAFVDKRSPKFSGR